MAEEFREIEDIIKEMDNADEEDVQLLREAQEVKQVTELPGYEIIQEAVRPEMERLEERIFLTKSMEECYGCAKALSGMKFVFSTVQDILEDGRIAAERLKEDSGDYS